MVLKSITKDLKAMKNQLEEREREEERKSRVERKNNITISGVKVRDHSEVEKKTRELLAQIVGREVNILEIREIGRVDYKRIVVRIESWEEKRAILIKKGP